VEFRMMTVTEMELRIAMTDVLSIRTKWLPACAAVEFRMMTMTEMGRQIA
jgi:hypothetical protein